MIRNPDSNKACGNDIIIIRMLKLFGDSICQPLEIFFKAYLRNGRFPLERKKANVVPIYKKDGKQTIESYRPASFPPICGKIFERLLYDTSEILASINVFQLIIKS